MTHFFVFLISTLAALKGQALRFQAFIGTTGFTSEFVSIISEKIYFFSQSKSRTKKEM